MMSEIFTDCRSEAGMTVGLIDSLITIAHILMLRDLTIPEVVEALADARGDEALSALFQSSGNSK